MSLTTEDASIQQLDKLYKIETECFTEEAFTKQQIAHLMKDYNSVNLVAKLNGEIVAFVIGMIYPERNTSTGHILTIDVLPSHRRKGIALKLLQEIEKIFREKGVKSCHLEVREDNTAALKLYQRLGYRKMAKLEWYYVNADGIYLRKDLTHS